jgi:hypothetical protein
VYVWRAIDVADIEGEPRAEELSLHAKCTSQVEHSMKAATVINHTQDTALRTCFA